MNTTTIDVSTLAPLTHADAMAAQAEELRRALDLLRLLSPEEWKAPTECPDWDVRRMYLHVLGACEGAGPREGIHQMRRARRRRKREGGPLEANLSAVQVAEREALSPEELIARLAAAAPKAVKRRSKLLGWFRRHMKLKVDGPVVETWTLGYLIDTIYLRDLWMHRVDASRATGHELVLTPDHDGRIVADVVAEWARRHGQAFTLELTGQAGGTFTGGGGATPTAMDAVEFCRALSGRAPAGGLMATVVPF